MIKVSKPRLYPGITCVNCNNSYFLKEHDGKDRLLNKPDHFEILKCKNCGIFYTYPQLSTSEMERYYPEEYMCYAPIISVEKNYFKRIDKQRALTKRRKHLERFFKGKGKILDIGCATGNFLNEMNNHGWECFGIEPDNKSAEYAKSTYNFPIFNGYLENTHFPDNYFDVITMWDVLEHTQNPSTIIKEVNRILKHEGLFLLSLPNSNSLERYLFGPYWAGWEVPRHYITFNDKNLKQFLEKEYFNNVKVDSFFGRHGLFMLSFKFWLDEVNLNKDIKNLIIKITNSIAIRLVTLPLFIFLESINRSTLMGVSAKKRTITP